MTEAATAGSAAAPASPGGSALAAGAPPVYDWVPEKHRVNRDDGTLDLEGSYRKTLASYASLVGRMGELGSRPRTPEEYSFSNLKLPPTVKAEELRADPAVAAILAQAHEMGLTDGQTQWALGTFFEHALPLVSAAPEIDAEDCEAALQEVWQSERAMTENVANAVRATNVLAAKAGVDVAELQRSLGNNAMFVRVMAQIGAEMREDRPAPTEAAGAAPHGDFDQQVTAIDVELEKLPQHSHERRHELIAQKMHLFEMRYGTRRAVLIPQRTARG